MATRSRFPASTTRSATTAKLVDDAADAVVISAGKGDDVVNDGRIRVTGAGGVGIRSETYGVVNNDGQLVATGKDGVAVDMNGEFGAVLNGGVIRAAKGADAIRADGDAPRHGGGERRHDRRAGGDQGRSRRPLREQRSASG